jgi:hypothetical protein
MKIFLTVIGLIALTAAAGAFELAPPVAPLTPPTPPSTSETQFILSPPAAPTAEYQALKINPGLFGWQRDGELTGLYLLNHKDQHGLLGLLAANLDLKFSDPWLIGRNLGLAEDALEYRLGLGSALGYGDDNLVLFSLFCDPSATLYFKEGSFWEGDPFIGLGFNLNLLGTDCVPGGAALKLYCGLDKELGLLGGKTELVVGYGGYRVGNARSAEGLFFSVGQPVRL